MICGGNGSPDADEAEDERLERLESGDQDDDEGYDQEDNTDETDENKTSDGSAKKKSRLRLAPLKKKAKKHGYEFSGATDVAGVLFVEIQRITDLPPEKNGKIMALIRRPMRLTRVPSPEDWFRYGSLCGYLSWEKDLSHSCSPP